MPYKRKRTAKRRFNKKRKATRRIKRFKSAPSKLMFRRGTGMPDTFFTKLSWTNKYEISGGGTGTLFSMMGNVPNKPDPISVTHAALYFDDLIDIYGSYYCAGSSIQLDVINISGTSAIQYVLFPSDHMNTIGVLNTLAEQPYAKYPKFVPIAQRVASRHKQFMTTKRIMGLNKYSQNSNAFGNNSNGPLAQWWWNFVAQNADNASTFNAVISIKIIYYIKFLQRNIQTEAPEVATLPRDVIFGDP